MTPTTRNSLAHGAIATISLAFVNVIGIYRALEPRLGAIEWEPWRPSTLLTALLLLDFLSYWGHRAAHRVSLLWAVHVVHHQSPHVDLATGLRSPALQIVLHAPWTALLAVSGIPFEPMLTVYLVHQLYKLAVHSEHPSCMDAASRWLVTPAFHRLHHGVGWDHVNFGAMLSIWDRAFGTFGDPTIEPVRYGTDAPLVHDVLRNNLDPLREWAAAQGSRQRAAKQLTPLANRLVAPRPEGQITQPIRPDGHSHQP